MTDFEGVAKMVKHAFSQQVRMTIKGAAVLVVLALAASMLAGCLSAQATAQSLQPAAEAKARSWDRSAELVVITGMEGENAQLVSQAAAMGGSGDHWERAREDPDPGNGRAEIWAYGYRNDDGEHLIVVVDRDREVVEQIELPEFLDFPAIGHYQVDSDKAMENAMDENKALREARNGDAFGVMSTLLRLEEDENPMWVIMGGFGSMQGDGGGGMVVIDALSGKVEASLDGWGHMGDWGMDHDWGHYGGDWGQRDWGHYGGDWGQESD